MTLEGDGKDFAKESPNRDNGVDEDGEDDGLEEDFDEEGNINLGAGSQSPSSLITLRTLKRFNSRVCRIYAP